MACRSCWCSQRVRLVCAGLSPSVSSKGVVRFANALLEMAQPILPCYREQHVDPMRAAGSIYLAIFHVSVASCVIGDFLCPPTQTCDIPHSSQRPEGIASGFRRGSAPSQYRPFAMTQNPVAANHTIAPPTKIVNSVHHMLNLSASSEATEM